jgi:hypothetical protein
MSSSWGDSPSDRLYGSQRFAPQPRGPGSSSTIHSKAPTSQADKHTEADAPGGPLYARVSAFVCPRGRVPADTEGPPCGAALQHASRGLMLARLHTPVPRRLTSLSLSAAQHKPAGMLRREAARARISVDDKPRDGLARGRAGHGAGPKHGARRLHGVQRRSVDLIPLPTTIPGARRSVRSLRTTSARTAF